MQQAEDVVPSIHSVLDSRELFWGIDVAAIQGLRVWRQRQRLLFPQRLQLHIQRRGVLVRRRKRLLKLAGRSPQSCLFGSGAFAD